MITLSLNENQSELLLYIGFYFVFNAKTSIKILLELIIIICFTCLIFLVGYSLCVLKNFETYFFELSCEVQASIVYVFNNKTIKWTVEFKNSIGSVKNSDWGCVRNTILWGTSLPCENLYYPQQQHHKQSVKPGPLNDDIRTFMNVSPLYYSHSNFSIICFWTYSKRNDKTKHKK